MIEALNAEFRELLSQTDYVLDEALVRAAVRQYLKARVRVLERDKDEAKRKRYLELKRRQSRIYRENGYRQPRGRDVVLKPAATRRRVLPVEPEPEKPRPEKKRSRPPKQPPTKETNYEVVWSGSDPLSRFQGNSQLDGVDLYASLSARESD